MLFISHVSIYYSANDVKAQVVQDDVIGKLEHVGHNAGSK